MVRGDARPRRAARRGAWATRSTRRRVLTKTSVERCSRAELGDPIVELGPLLVGARPRRARRCGTSTARSSSRRCPASTIARRAAARCPTRRRAATSIGRTVAESPMRCGRGPPARRTRSSSRSSESARCAPRLSRGDRVDLVDDDGAHRARAPRRPDSEVSRMKSDSGVVTRTCGGRFAGLLRARSRACRRCAPRRGSRGGAKPSSRGERARSRRWARSRFLWMSFESALSGET